MTKLLRLVFVFLILFLFTIHFTSAQEINKKAESERLITEASQNLTEKKYDDVIEKTSKVLEWFPKSGDVFFIRAMAFQGKGVKEKAIEDLSSALTSNVNVELKLLTFKFRGMLYYQTQKYDESIRDYDFVLSVDSTDFRDFTFRGWSHFFKENYDLAIADFNKVLELDPEGNEILYLRGKSYYALGNFQKSVEDINQLLKLNSDPPIDAYLVRANAYRKLGKKELADADEKKFTELGGKLPDQKTNEAGKKSADNDNQSEKIERLKNIVIKDLAEKNFVSAFKDVDELIKSSPVQENYKLKSLVYTARSASYFIKGDYENSLNDLNEAIKIDETSDLALKARAAVFKKLGKLKEAEADEKKAGELKAKNDDSNNKSNSANR